MCTTPHHFISSITAWSGSNALRRVAAALAASATQEERDDEPDDLRPLSHCLELVGRRDDAFYLRTYP